MSEHLSSREHHEALPSPERQERIEAHAKPEKQHARKAEKDPHQLLNEARKDITETASEQHSALKHLEASEEAPQISTPATTSRSLKKETLKRELKSIQRKLPARERALSRVVHQPVVRVVSEAAAKSVSRPSGMLGGGLVALVGTTGYLYLAKHLGFRYNYFVFIVLFAGGFVLGLVLELLVHVATNPRRHAND